LQTLVGIETKPYFTVPDVTEGDRYPQFAPSGFGPSRIDHPRPQDTQLKLADAAFHAQKKPVVRPTRIVDTVRINNPGFDKPAQLEQMVPISAVAREP
jgi:hypothetical protein